MKISKMHGGSGGTDQCSALSSVIVTQLAIVLGWEELHKPCWPNLAAAPQPRSWAQHVASGTVRKPCWACCCRGVTWESYEACWWQGCRPGSCTRHGPGKKVRGKSSHEYSGPTLVHFYNRK
ncbi:UNVERIFIED_CONTAM: hypothetical protein K2H54_044402 [Gekko kuhli]